MNNCLIIFAKNPRLGKTKTRIGKKLGDDVALAVYYQLIHKAQEVTKDLVCNKAVYYADFVDSEDSWDNDEYEKFKQVQTDLGGRMFAAINAQLEAGFEKVILIGTDIYTLSEAILNQAFDLLDAADVVLGPAKDGGYYLIGMKQPHREIFNLSAWSTPSVLSETLGLIKKNGLSYETTSELNDIDEPEDLIGTDLERFLK